MGVNVALCVSTRSVFSRAWYVQVVFNNTDHLAGAVFDPGALV